MTFCRWRDEVVPDMARRAATLVDALRKAAAGFEELHGQGIGCPDCEPDNPDGSPRCAAITQVRVALGDVPGLR